MASERQIRVGGVPVGGGAPVVVQSMTLTKTHDVDATMAQIGDLVSAGCELVRVAVPKNEDAEVLAKLVYLSPIPVIADIHFNASLALKAIEAGGWDYVVLQEQSTLPVKNRERTHENIRLFDEAIRAAAART